MNLKESVVTKSEVKGPFKGQYGDYFSQQLELDGERFTKTSKTNTPLASEGDLVKVLFNTKTTDKGSFNNIEKLEVLSEGHQVTKTEIKELIATPKTVESAVAPSVTKSVVTKSTSYDSNGARNGMIVGKAVELAIARSTSGEIEMDDLHKAALDVLALTDFVEKGSESKKASK